MKEDIQKITFRTCYSHEFIVTPFGVCNASGVFVDLMNKVFSPYLDKFVVIFIDDILVYSKNEEEHEEHLRIVLQTLRQEKLYARYNKCEFWLKSISYLGHIISGGVSVDLSKITAVKDFSVSKIVSEVKSFVGMTGYYQSFAKNFSKIAALLTKLTRKGEKFIWTDECTIAFEKLKNRLITTSILKTPTGTGGIVIYSDALGKGFGNTTWT